MSSSLVNWVVSIYPKESLTSTNILNGVVVNYLMKQLIESYNYEIISSETLAERVNNWNAIIRQLSKINIKVTQQTKNKIIQGNEELVYDLIAQLKIYQNNARNQVDLTKIIQTTSFQTAKSLLELFILLINKYFGLNSKEAITLLSNDSKYFAHILIKGYKNDEKPVLNLLQNLQHLLHRIEYYCKNVENYQFFLKTIKPGLISKYQSICDYCLIILQKFISSKNNCFQIIKTQIINPLMLCYQRHPFKIHRITQFVLNLTQFNQKILTLFKDNTNEKQYLEFVLEIMIICDQQSKNKQLCSFKLNSIIQMIVKSLNNSELFINSLYILIKLIEINYKILLKQEQTLQNIVPNLETLKLKNKNDSLLFLNGTFILLDHLGARKNSLAPALFKMLVNKYKICNDQDIIEFYIYNFINLLHTFPNIPFSIILDTMVYKANFNKIRELQLQFLIQIIFKKDENIVENVYSLISKIFMQYIGYQKFIEIIINNLIQKKQNSENIIEIIIRIVKIFLAVHYSNFRKLNQSKLMVENTIQINENNICFKIKNIQIQTLIQSIVKNKHFTINENIEPLICYSYLQIKQKNEQMSKGLRKIIVLFGSPQKLINSYSNNIKRLHSDSRSLNRIKVNKINNNNNKYKMTPKNTNENLQESNKSIRPDTNSILMSKLNHKVSLDAQQGLNKYQKVYQSKLEKQHLQQIQYEQAEQKKQQLKQIFTSKMLAKGILIQKDSAFNCVYQLNVKEKELEKDKTNDLSHLPLYNPQQQQERDLKGLQYIMKRYEKVLKVYYSDYGGKLRPNNVKLFEELSETKHLMQTANVWKLLKNHVLDEFISIREVQYLIQRTNKQLKKNYRESVLLDFQAFVQFIIQVSIVMFSRPPKDLRGCSISEMVEQTFYRFKLFSTENKIDQRLFDDTENLPFVQTQIIRQLNQKLQQNSDYILPEGYKKIANKKIVLKNKLIMKSLNDSYAQVYEILDEIMWSKLEFHIIELFAMEETTFKARPTMYQLHKSEQVSKQLHLSVNMKKQIANFNLNDRDIVKDCAYVLLDIIQAVQDGKKRLEEKYSNKYLKQKYEKERQKRKKEEQQRKNWKLHDDQIHKKVKQNKEKLAEKIKQEQEQKKIQKQKEYEEQKKKERRDQKLKKKLSEYLQKKKVEEEEEKVKKKLQMIKYKQEQQRIKKDIQYKKKIIEESKQKKIDELKQLTKQKQEQKRKQRKKMMKKQEQNENKKKIVEQYKIKKNQSIQQNVN